MNSFGTIRVFIFLAFCFVNFSVRAQKTIELDSLLDVVTKLPNDTIKVQAYSRISRMYFLMRNQIKLARQYADSTLWLSGNLHFEKGIFQAYYRYSEIEQFEGNYHEAIDHLNKYLQFYEYRKDSFQIVNALFGLGKAYKNLGEFDESLNNFFRAIKICERTNDREGTAMAWNGVSGIYRQMGDLRKAIVHYDQANKIYQALGKTKDYAMGLQNVANVYLETENYDSARVLYEQALVLIRDLNLKYEEAIILGNMGELHNNLHQYQTALSYHLQALAIRRTLPNKRSLTYGLIYVGRTYFNLKIYSEATKYLDEALHLAQEIRSMDLLLEIYNLLSDISAGKRDYKSAYEFANLSHQWKDSIFNEEKTKQIEELQTKYETEKKDKQITLLAKEKEIQQKETERQTTLKKAFSVGFVLMCVLSVLLFYLFRQRLRNQKLVAAKNEEIKEANFKRQLSELEMKALRAQINPHFLFNCMNSINRMILEGEPENASRYLSKFSKLVRLILENSETNQVSLENELAMIESYIQLEELRFKEKISYSILVDDEIEPENTFLPPMILPPFVENAIWHGLMHREEKENGKINIMVKEEGDRLFCSIEDNGVGREKAKSLRQNSVWKSKSMGMKITEERLRLLSKEKLQELIHITDLKGHDEEALGTRVDIHIPVT